MKVDNSYDWIKKVEKQSDGCSLSSYDTNMMYDIINKNRYNQSPKKYSCEKCKSVNWLTGSYISLIEEDDFLNNSTKYIDNAFEKSENDASGYEICLS